MVFLNSYFEALANILAKRLFFLEEVFLWIKLVLQALSIALKAVGNKASASLILLATINFLTFLTVSETASLLFILKTALCFEALRAFLADDVIGMERD